MEVNGKIHKIMEVQNLKGDFKKRDFVLLYNENEQYPQYVKFEIFGDKCSMLDNYREGDDIKVYFDLRGREWKNPEGNIVYFTTLGAWKIERSGNGSSSNASPQQPKPATNVSDAPPPSGDDLPF